MTPYDKPKPPKQYTVVVKIIEVTPVYREGAGPSAIVHDRQTEEVLSVGSRATSEREAVTKAMMQLDTHLKDIPGEQ